MTAGSSDTATTEKLKSVLAERRKTGNWGDLISKNRKRLVRTELARICSICTSSLKDPRAKALLLKEEEELRREGLLLGDGEVSSNDDRDEAFGVIEERLEALDRAIAERKAFLDEVRQRAAEYQHHLVDLLRQKRAKAP